CIVRRLIKGALIQYIEGLSGIVEAPCIGVADASIKKSKLSIKEGDLRRCSTGRRRDRRNSRRSPWELPSVAHDAMIIWLVIDVIPAAMPKTKRVTKFVHERRRLLGNRSPRYRKASQRNRKIIGPNPDRTEVRRYGFRDPRIPSLVKSVAED